MSAATDALNGRIDDILATQPLEPPPGKTLGRSRDGRTLRAFHLEGGPLRVSLLGGCHADEPVGPRLLGHLTAYLSQLPETDPLLRRYEWWIVPHINPDGAERNRSWQYPDADAYELTEYLTGAVRELPGDDIEFGFPRDEDDWECRPENRAVYDWWRTADGPFALHVSLHGMAFAAGPWFLIEAAWKDRCAELKRRCADKVRDLGYVLHDVERQGEKGFFRLGRGFCTRPDSRYMRLHFEHLGDRETAEKFRPSSMETIRALGGDPLTLVSEMPLFLTPGVGAVLGPPDPAAEEWKGRIAEWRDRLAHGDPPEQIARAAQSTGLSPMPSRDQMMLQWAFIVAGLEQVARA